MWWQMLIMAIVGVATILWFMRSYFMQQARNFPAITREEFETLVDNGAIVVDLRRDSEFNRGHIPGAVHIPAESAKKEFPVKFPDREKDYILYCSSGLRSNIVVDQLRELDYTNLHNFKKMKRYKGDLVKE